MLRTAAAVIFFACTTAQAGVIYHFRTVSTSPHGSSEAAGRVWTEGQRYRVELDPGISPRQYDIAISHDADATATHISLSKRTIFERPKTTVTRSSMLFQMPAPGALVQGHPRVRHRVSAGEMIVGHYTSKHVVEVEYELMDQWDETPVRAKIRATVSLWTAHDLPALPFRRSVQSGYAHVDREIVKVFDKIPGMTLKHEMRVSRKIENGPTQTETVTTVVDDLEVADILPAVFEVPPGFR
jgi:hypothetical protein